MIIRKERPGDEVAIHSVTNAAFADQAHASGTEARIVDALRADGDLTLSLVAELNGEIIGQISFSPVAIDGAHSGWFGLGPVSVHPDHQHVGVGSALIRQGLERLASSGAAGCALIGSPDYYSRFGFFSDGQLGYGDVPAPYVQRVVLAGPDRVGDLVYGVAFSIT